MIAAGNLSTLGVLFSYTGFILLWATCFLTGGLSWHEGFCPTGRSLHLQHISKDGSWGNPLTLLAIAHILRRPIEFITDSVSSDRFTTAVEPPDLLHPDRWGSPVQVTLRMDRHFDGVQP